MTLPKQLQADPEYPHDIRDENGELVVGVYSRVATPKELRDEIIRRWNEYQILRDTLSACHKLLDENT